MPRIPFAADFWAFANAVKELARLLLPYEKLEPWPLVLVYSDDERPAGSAGSERRRLVPLSYRVDTMTIVKGLPAEYSDGK